MNDLKLNRWKERFEQEVKNITIEYDAFFLNEDPKEFYTIQLNDRGEWALELREDLPNEVKARLKQTLLNTKP